ncbi:ABC-2 type transport system permease protein [Lysobacter sp. HA18]
MNAMTDTMPRTQVAAPHATHKFKLLLKREFWEHKGGFFWAPLIAGGIFLLLTLMGMITAEVAKSRAGEQNLNINGSHIQVGALDLSKLTQHLSAEDLRQFGGAIDLTLMMSAGIPFIVLGFVVFFYALGSLYDDRRDRSVLFWKSMPLSDSQTVLSKLASATLVAPALAALAGIATMIVLMVMLSLFVLLHGGNPMTLLWGPASPTSVIATFIAGVPVYAAWALPTVGWLMLCSAWARSKPFLWALVVPVFVGIFVSWFDLLHFVNLDTTWYWQNIVLRLLGSTFPTMLPAAANLGTIHVNSPADLDALATVRSLYALFATPSMWVGIVAGLAMIVAAIRLRRWRDEG